MERVNERPDQVRAVVAEDPVMSWELELAPTDTNPIVDVLLKYSAGVWGQLYQGGRMVEATGFLFV
jgi:hypothetical protein